MTAVTITILLKGLFDLGCWWLRWNSIHLRSPNLLCIALWAFRWYASHLLAILLLSIHIVIVFE